MSFIKKYSDGFDLYGDNVIIFLDKETGKYSVTLSISSNTWNSRIYTITSQASSGDATFDSNLKKLLASCPNKFSSVLENKREVKTFLGSSTVYDVTATLPGIFDLSYSTGGFSLTDELDGVSYQGLDQTEAKNRYNSLAEKVKKSLGANYVYLKTEDSKGEYLKHVFTAKTGMKDEKTSVVTVSSTYSTYDKKYSVKISFAYKGFGGIL